MFLQLNNRYRFRSLCFLKYGFDPLLLLNPFKKRAMGWMMLVFLIGTSQNVLAQHPWSAEFRPGLNIPLIDLEDDNLEVGFGFEASISYKLMPHFKATAGWSYNNFETDQNEMKNSTRLNENSFAFGFEFKLPITESPVSYYVQGAGILGQMQLLDAQKTFNERSEYGIGWQIGAGAEFDLDDRWSLRPEIRFRSLSRDVDIGSSTIDVNLDYISIGIGLSRTF